MGGNGLLLQRQDDLNPKPKPRGLGETIGNNQRKYKSTSLPLINTLCCMKSLSIGIKAVGKTHWPVSQQLCEAMLHYCSFLFFRYPCSTLKCLYIPSLNLKKKDNYNCVNRYNFCWKQFIKHLFSVIGVATVEFFWAQQCSSLKNWIIESSCFQSAWPFGLCF